MSRLNQQSNMFEGEESRPKKTITTLSFDLITIHGLNMKTWKEHQTRWKLRGFAFNNHGHIRPWWIM